MSLPGLPYNGAKPSASPGPTTTFTSSSGNVGPSDVTPDPSRSESTNLGTQSGQLNGMTLGAANPSSANSGTNPSTELPAIRLQRNHSERSSPSKEGGTSWLSRKTSKRSHAKSKVDNVFEGITLDIPSGGLSDELSADEMEFSKRGSMLVDAPKAKASQPASTLDPQNPISGTMRRSSRSLRARVPAKILSRDEEALSQKVRSFYEVGAELPHDADSNS